MSLNKVASNMAQAFCMSTTEKKPARAKAEKKKIYLSTFDIIERSIKVTGDHQGIVSVAGEKVKVQEVYIPETESYMWVGKQWIVEYTERNVNFIQL